MLLRYAVKKVKDMPQNGKTYLYNMYLRKAFQLNKTIQLFLNGAKDMNRYFTKAEMQAAKKNMNRYSTSLVTRALQIKSKCGYPWNV